MKRKTISVLIISIVTFSILAMSLISIGTWGRDSIEPEPIMLGPEFRNQKVEFYNVEPDPIVESTALPSSSEDALLGTYELWITYDDYFGYIFLDWYQLQYIGEYCEVWVQYDMQYYESDGVTLQERDADVVTPQQVEYIGMEYDNNIHLQDTAYFGDPMFLDGTYGPYGSDSEDGKTAILLSNVRDELYYDPTYTSYIAGFYWGSVFELYTDRNVITIDTYNWALYVGDNPIETSTFRYEGTIAHEFQHLIHADWNPGDATFMNEGCSMFAEFVCGYPIDYSRMNDFFKVPDNSLTIWGDLGQSSIILTDYGQVLLWAIYLNDQYGSEFLSYFVQNGIPGVEGINAALAYFGFTDTFDDAFHNWRIANYVHSDNPGHGKYNYKSFDMTAAIEEGLLDPIRIYEVEGRNIPWTTGTSFGSTEITYGSSTYTAPSEKVGSYGTDYIRLTQLKNLNLIFFQGDSAAEVPPPIDYDWIYDYNYVPLEDMYLPGEGWWYSGYADLFSSIIVGDVHVDETNTLLTFDTYFDIEPNWDFGFVQVSTDGGLTWTSLANEYTTFEIASAAHPDIAANLPGLTGWSGYEAYPVLEMTFDLYDYRGMDVQIGFNYMTDWNTGADGWYVSNVVASLAPVELYNVPPVVPPVEVNWMVSVVQEKTTPGHDHYTFVWDIPISDMYDGGATLAYLFGHYDNLILIVSPVMDRGLADYSFKTMRSFKKCFFI
jgi:hypothetical protein